MCPIDPLPATDFPALTTANHSVTSDHSLIYNCIAWSLGDISKWWWPEIYGYWPEGCRRSTELSSFVDMYEYMGYSITSSLVYSTTERRIAIFVKDNKATHAAVQLDNSRWSSKLGQNQDIVHTLSALEGPLYGSVQVYMVKSEAQLNPENDR
jgi:hypothetical protein